MRLTGEEKAMRDGRDGRTTARAMNVLLRYGTALGAESLVETRNVCGTVTADAALAAIQAGTVQAGVVLVMSGAGPSGGPAMGGRASRVVFALDGAGLGD